MRLIALAGLLLGLPAWGEYEVRGEGRPVALLHGGMNTIQTSFAVLARNHPGTNGARQYARYRRARNVL